VSVHVRYFAAARDAAGVPGEDVPPGAGLADTLAGLVAGHAGRPELARVVGRSTFLVDGRRRDPGDTSPLADGATLDVLPPFAGG